MGVMAGGEDLCPKDPLVVMSRYMAHSSLRSRLKYYKTTWSNTKKFELNLINVENLTQVVPIDSLSSAGS